MGAPSENEQSDRCMLVRKTTKSFQHEIEATLGLDAGDHANDRAFPSDTERPAQLRRRASGSKPVGFDGSEKRSRRPSAELPVKARRLRRRAEGAVGPAGKQKPAPGPPRRWLGSGPGPDDAGSRTAVRSDGAAHKHVIPGVPDVEDLGAFGLQDLAQPARVRNVPQRPYAAPSRQLHARLDSRLSRPRPNPVGFRFGRLRTDQCHLVPARHLREQESQHRLSCTRPLPVAGDVEDPHAPQRLTCAVARPTGRP